MKLLIPHYCWHKLKKYTELAEGEISGLGLVEYRKVVNSVYSTSEFIVQDVYLFKQKSTYTSTELDHKNVAEFFGSLADKGIDTNKIKFWWHTHGNLDVFWSKTDVMNIEDFDLEKPDDNWLVSMVLNKKGDFKARIDIFDPVRVSIQDIRVEIIEPAYEKLDHDLQKEVQEKVSFKEPSGSKSLIDFNKLGYGINNLSDNNYE